jgi:hypothetical protein
LAQMAPPTPLASVESRERMARLFANTLPLEVVKGEGGVQAAACKPCSPRRLNSPHSLKDAHGSAASGEDSATAVRHVVHEARAPEEGGKVRWWWRSVLRASDRRITVELQPYPQIVTWVLPSAEMAPP